MSDDRQPVYLFEGFRLDARRRVLLGADGQPIPLTSRLFDTLLYLVERPGELVTKEKLLEAIWPDVIVEEQSLGKTISALRKELGEKPEEHRFIVTKHGRGYRFVAQVSVVRDAAPRAATAEREGGTATPAVATAPAIYRAAKPAATMPTRSLRARVLATVGAVSAVALAATYLRSPNVAPVAPTIRFTVPIPGGNAQETTVALSPDGRHLAIATDDGNERALWIQSLDSLQARQLPGTEGARAPFWSPDSEQVGFITADGAKRVRADGSMPPAIIASQTNLGNGSWSRAGTILLGGRGDLFMVNAAGGTPRALHLAQGDRAAYGFRDVSFLPDGEHFVSMFIRNTESGIWLGSLADVAIKQLLVDYSNALYAPGADDTGDGYLVWRRGTRLVAQRFDAEQGVLRGDLVALADDVQEDFQIGAFGVSASGALAYIAPPATDLVWVDRSGMMIESVTRLTNVEDVRLSVDETRIAYSHSGRGGGRDVWQLDLRRGTKERLTFGPFPSLLPIWSPDASRIAFTSSRGSGFDPYLTSMPRGESLLVDIEPIGGSWPLDWSRDGVVLHAAGGDLWAIDVARQQARPYLLTPFVEGPARFSPNGRWVAYASNESGREEVYVRTFPEAGRQHLVSIGGGTEPQWRDDGREIYYVDGSGDLAAVAVEEAGDTFNVGAPQRLFASATGYQAGRGGQRFLLTRQAEAGVVTVVLNWQSELSE